MANMHTRRLVHIHTILKGECVQLQGGGGEVNEEEEAEEGEGGGGGRNLRREELGGGGRRRRREEEARRGVSPGGPAPPLESVSSGAKAGGKVKSDRRGRKETRRNATKQKQVEKKKEQRETRLVEMQVLNSRGEDGDFSVEENHEMH
ncbi:hypothetical protein EYF80_000405 [Liparis tanakae]|uniref:Uncharacterized protein n=1 Tax=Liparis tanakae TaxID=230148 RepID=A0A4Z2JGN6_9TELE|nr:hypothetical protein EYF80_000405 [Liparis tanakae]